MAKEAKNPGKVLKAMMDDYQLSTVSLAKEIKASQSVVSQITIGNTKISVPMSLRLAKFFNTTPIFWLDLQRDYDLSLAEQDKALSKIITSIVKGKKPAAKANKTASPAVKGRKLNEKTKTLPAKRKRPTK